MEINTTMKVYQYNDYKDYVEAQTAAYNKKITNSFVDPNSIKMLSDYILNSGLTPKMMLCHGTRRGIEQMEFIKHLATPELIVMGTEIAKGSEKYPNTIEFDFHNVMDSWIGNVDVIYSNAFDHTYKPVECLDAWMGCLTTNGMCILEYNADCDTVSNQTDSFGATLDDYIELITNKYDLAEILDNSDIPDLGETHKGHRLFLIIKNRK